MSSVKAIFKKQTKDVVKNMAILLQFIIYPGIAFAMMSVMDTDVIPAEMLAAMPNMVIMMASIFAGMGLIPTVAGIIAEDREKKSLRFLIMAGVKPSAYLLGVGGVIFLISIFTALGFGFVSDFSGQDFWIFVAAIMSGVTASILLGATFGIISKNQQSATGLAMPATMILGFGPMMAQFNDTIARVLHIFYTQQFSVVADSLMGFGSEETILWHSFAIMWANVAVLAVLFVFVFTKKGLKG